MADPSTQGQPDPTSLERITERYKNARELQPNLPPVEDVTLVLQWLNTVEHKDDQNITEDDILPTIETASTSSTNYYGQESFKAFQPKLFKLIAGIIPNKVHLTMVGRMKGGGNNRVAGIRLDWPAGMECKINGKVFFRAQEEDTEVRAVFRACRWPTYGKPDPEIADNYAVLTELTRFGLKVPTVIAYDSTCENSMGVPFMLLERLPGFRLDDIYGNLTLKQKERVARLVAEQLNSFDNVKGDKMGKIKGAIWHIPQSQSFMQEVPKGFKVVTQDFITGRHNKFPVRSSRSIYTVMRRMFDNWISIAKDRNMIPNESRAMDEIYPYLFEELRAVLEVMKIRGFFEGPAEGNIALHHPDFFARNIIVGASCRRPDNLDFEIEGIIDWDETVYLPEVLRCSPCAWLWELAGPQVTNVPVWEEYYGDSDELPSSRFEFRLNTDERRIKAAFDEGLSESKRNLMYKVEYVWIRRLWKFACWGVYLRYEHEVNRFTRFLENWADYVKATRHRFPQKEANRYVTISPMLEKILRENIKSKDR
ncbi:hypothetical protein TWF730_011216 [Orbilia blumenaviensis]|uniref:Aminoglycoside phosphotransferase domain-containing protein n=1 Tax=Orbilia blumenaviensis TaxID=1796055 RepID=A0AAV9UKM6_9PEZI